MTTALRHAADRVAYEPAFLANDLRIFAELNDTTRDALEARLALTDTKFDELALCRTPHRDGRFRDDLLAIASLVDADPIALANMVRLVDASTALASAPATKVAPMLAAAREIAQQPVRTEPPNEGLQATWLTEAVELLWGDAAAEDFPRDVELALLWRMPLAIIELEQLSGVNVGAWLSARGVHLPVHVPPGSLHGALVAFAGSGVLFLDAADDPAQRRLTAAHEGAHFVVDYWLPRLKLAQRAPQLLEVVDGLREPDPEDHVDALLARIPFGVHTHLFERDEAGGTRNIAVDHAEDRATQVAWELLAPREVVAARTARADEFTVVRTLEAEFGLPRTAAREYAGYLRASGDQRRGRRRFDWS
ncbi:hypothetical protein HJD18_16275 [Thermoleophilia bacterium SCSIO 60948]|nr:hypothetical protein HJD18_16275 [Thermoleophilia bacterium SCSIO 60948]